MRAVLSIVSACHCVGSILLIIKENSFAGFKLKASAFFYFFFMFILDLALFTYFGQFLVFLTPSQGLAQIIASGAPPVSQPDMPLHFPL